MYTVLLKQKEILMLGIYSWVIIRDLVFYLEAIFNIV